MQSTVCCAGRKKPTSVCGCAHWSDGLPNRRANCHLLPLSSSATPDTFPHHATNLETSRSSSDARAQSHQQGVPACWKKKQTAKGGRGVTRTWLTGLPWLSRRALPTTEERDGLPELHAELHGVVPWIGPRSQAYEAQNSTNHSCLHASKALRQLQPLVALESSTPLAVSVDVREGWGPGLAF